MKHDRFEITDSISCRNSFLSNKWSATCISLLALPVIAALIIPNVLFYLMLPTLCMLFANKHFKIKYFFLAVQIPMTNQTNITQPKVHANLCGGVSSYTNWVGNVTPTQGIYTYVSTSNCAFNTTPLYYISIEGKQLQTDFTGYNDIYNPTRYGFLLLLYSYQGLNAEQLLNYSQTEQWNISWVGVYQ